MPPKFIMRREYLGKVVPALRKIIDYPLWMVYVDFSKVEEITDGTYMVFLAQVEKAIINKNKRVRMYVKKLPKSKKVLNTLMKQTKYEHQNIRITSNVVPNLAGSFDKVEPEFIDKIVQELKKIGISEYYQPFYDFLIELIGNATEHGIQNKNINWWLLRYRELDKKMMRYVFVDMGNGIIKSYEKSGLRKKFTFNKDTKNIPLDALNGKLGSSTQEEGRGRGLPQIREIIENGFVSNFVLITNTVSLCYSDGKFDASTNPDFAGTYYTWTINKEDYTRWKNFQ